MRRPSLLPLVAVLALGCGDSHGPGDGGSGDAGPPGLDAGPPAGDAGPGGCEGAAPSCYQGWSGFDHCCLEGTERAATCVADRWSCASGSYLEGDCGHLDPMCEGIDAGVPPPPRYDSCSVTSDCVLTANTCCGVCGRPTADDVDAVRMDRAMDYYLDVACPEARDGAIDCPDCPSALNPGLVATCDASTGGRCEVVDIDNDPSLAGCASDSDCVVRVPDCCECGADTSPFRLIAVAADSRGALERLVCDPDSGCPECAPVYPEGASAVCDGGLCRVVIASP